MREAAVVETPPLHLVVPAPSAPPPALLFYGFTTITDNCAMAVISESIEIPSYLLLPPYSHRFETRRKIYLMTNTRQVASRSALGRQKEAATSTECATDGNQR
jgi:hypothetical protein